MALTHGGLPADQCRHQRPREVPCRKRQHAICQRDELWQPVISKRVTYLSLASEAHRTGEPIGIELADDAQALKIAKQLVTAAGFEVVGDLSTAKRFDNGSPIYPKTLPASEMRAILGLK